MYYAIEKNGVLSPIVVNKDKDIAGRTDVVKSDKPIKTGSTYEGGKIVDPVIVVKPTEPAKVTLESLNEKLDILIAKQKANT